MKKFIAACVLATLAGCGSTSQPSNYSSETQCSDSNWQNVGYEVAMAGKSVRTFNQLKESCKDSIVPEARTSYLAGYQQGIKEFCSFENGLEQGKEGKLDVTACPKELRAEFERGYTIAAKAVEMQNEKAKRAADREQMRQQQTSDLIGAGRSQ